MSEPRVEALLRHEPLPGLPEEVRAAHKQALRAQIAADPATAATPAPRPARPRRRWRRGGITLLAGGLLLAGAGAATAFLTIELCGYGWAEGRLPWPETKPPATPTPTPNPYPNCRPASCPTASSESSPATNAPAPNSAYPNPQPDPGQRT